MPPIEHSLPSIASFPETLRSMVEGLRTETAAAHALDDLYADPETVKRIGVTIATAAMRGVAAKY